MNIWARRFILFDIKMYVHAQVSLGKLRAYTLESYTLLSLPTHSHRLRCRSPKIANSFFPPFSNAEMCENLHKFNLKKNVVVNEKRREKFKNRRRSCYSFFNTTLISSDNFLSSKVYFPFCFTPSLRALVLSLVWCCVKNYTQSGFVFLNQLEVSRVESYITWAWFPNILIYSRS